MGLQRARPRKENNCDREPELYCSHAVQQHLSELADRNFAMRKAKNSPLTFPVLWRISEEKERWTLWVDCALWMPVPCSGEGATRAGSPSVLGSWSCSGSLVKVMPLRHIPCTHVPTSLWCPVLWAFPPAGSATWTWGGLMQFPETCCCCKVLHHWWAEVPISLVSALCLERHE